MLRKGCFNCTWKARNRSGLRIAGGSAFNAVPDTMFYEGERQDDLAQQSSMCWASLCTREAANGHRDSWQSRPCDDPGGRHQRHCSPVHCADERSGVESKAIVFIAQEIGEDPNATRIFGVCADEPSGKLKFNVGMIDLGEVERISIDCRIPVTVAKGRSGGEAERSGCPVRAGVQRVRLAGAALPSQGSLHDRDVDECLPPASAATTVSEPVSSGGATYARAMDNCVAFGALTHDELLTEHQPNERAVLKNLYRAMEIYAHAIHEQRDRRYADKPASSLVSCASLVLTTLYGIST